MGAAAVSFAAVSCRFGQVTVVDSVRLDVAAGEHVAITGANGSGKTTLLRAALGLHPLAAGTVSVGGQPARCAADWVRRRREVAWVPQRLATGFFPLLVEELLASAGAGADAACHAATELGMVELGARPLHTLSGGQLQRAFLARAMGCIAAGARVLFADEPSAALDFAGQEQVARLLAGLPVTVVVISHDRAVTRACDRVAEMAAGRLRVVA
ncbi:MAG: ATP-binding cassette domain-containing protein [Pseudonocardia sp.]|nr:ATP-binding cassette domain-containing protein [Pseudonocardia sp.]